MAWTTPRTWVTSEVVTASILNTHIRDNLNAVAPGSMPIPLLFSSGDTVLQASTGTGKFKSPFACTLVSGTATVGVAPTGTSIKVDVNKNGATMFTTKPEIAVSATASTATTPSVTAIAVDDVITVDVDQVGSTVAGENLTVILEITVP